MNKVPVLIALALTAMATPALANSEERVSRISTAGLDLGDPADRAALDAQIKQAADKVCGVQENFYHTDRWIQARHCAVVARRKASNQINEMETLAAKTSATRKGG